MNIVFVKSDIDNSSSMPYSWRGELMYRAIKKNGLHSAIIISIAELITNSSAINKTCSSSQLIFIQAFPDLDLLNIVNYWKSRDKKVVVDIPLCTELLFFNNGDYSNKSNQLVKVYSDFQNNNLQKLDQMEKFRWGLHLADLIILSSHGQMERWQTAGPVKVIPEFVELDSISSITRVKNKQINIGIFSNTDDEKDPISEIIDPLIHDFPESKINHFHLKKFQDCENEKESKENSPFFHGNPIDFDLGVFIDTWPLRGIFRRNILEFLALNIPFLLYENNGYQDLAKYGLIIKDSLTWRNQIIGRVQKSEKSSVTNDDGYIYAIGQNIDDHINYVLNIFSEIIKSSS